MKTELNLKKFTNKYSFVILALFIAIGSSWYYGEYNKVRYKILVIGKDLKVIDWNADTNKVDKSESLWEIQGSSLREFYAVKNPKKNELMILQKLHSGKSQIYKLTYNSLGGKRMTIKMLNTNAESLVSKEKPVGADFFLNGLYGGNGTVRYYPENRKQAEFLEKSGYKDLTGYDYKVTNFDDIDGMTYIGNDIVIIQDKTGRRNSSYSSIYWNDLIENRILLYSLKERKILKQVIYGYSPRGYVSSEVQEYTLPLAVSPAKDKAAFLARINDSNVKHFSKDPAPIWFCTIDLKNFSIEKIVPINCPSKHHTFRNHYPMVWGRYRGRDYIAFSIMDASIDPDEEAKDISILIDVENKKVLSIWPWESKSMRWSPDGRYLGMLRIKRYYKRKLGDEMEDGSLYAYDLKKNQLSKIDQDTSSHDFFWMD